MPSFTVQSMVDRAAAIADMHDTFVSPAQWLAWFNVERRALEIFKARASGGVLQNIDSLVVTGVDRVPLTIAGVNEFLAVVGVWERISTGALRPLKIVNWVDNFWQDEAGPISGKAQCVTIEDANEDGSDVATHLRFFPRDPTGTYVIMVIKAPTAAASLATTFSQPVGLEERIVLGMAKKALIKEESDTEAVDRLISEQNALIEEYCWGRSFAQGAAVRNVDRTQRGWLSLEGFVPPGPEFWAWL